MNLVILSGVLTSVFCFLSAAPVSTFYLAAPLDQDGDTVTTTCLTVEPVLDPAGKPTQSLVYSLPGETHLQRVLNEAAGPATATPMKDKLSMAYFYLMTDIHIADEEAPSRLIFFDFLFDSAWRPQEDRGVHVFNAVIQTGNGLMDTYGRDFDFVMSLGDTVDNAQENEISWFIQAVKGEESLNPDSGDPGRTFGTQTPFVYVDESSNDVFQSLGLKTGIPFYAVVGNHDALWMGSLPESLTTPDLFVGEWSPWGFLSMDHSEFQFTQIPVCVSTAGCNESGSTASSLPTMDIMEMTQMSTDPGASDQDAYLFVENFIARNLGEVQSAQTFDDRMFVNHDLFIERMKYEGFILNSEGVPENMGYYNFDAAGFPIRYIVMDTEDRPNLDNGGLGNEQFAWVEQKILEAADPDNPRLVVIMSHHQVKNGLDCASADCRDGEDLKNLFCEYPNVIAVFNGHGHDNRVLAQQCAEEDPSDGFWEVETASLIDFPQHSRIAEIAYNYDGTGSLLLTMVNHQYHAPVQIAHRSRNDSWKDFNNPDKNTLAVDEAGEIWKVIDPDVNPRYAPTNRGTRDDRNVELVFPVPPNIAALLEDIPFDPGTTTELFYECPAVWDNDGDGYDDIACGGTDCNDADPNTYPGAMEQCDSKDNDCNLTVPADETDDDTDGYVECTPWVGLESGILGGQDCDDSNPAVSPGLVEKGTLCSNGLDDDCDGAVDGDDSGCQGYSATANAEAATYGAGSLAGSGVCNELALLLIPAGAVFLLRIIRRK